jgi:hypothetical protein
MAAQFRHETSQYKERNKSEQDQGVVLPPPNAELYLVMAKKSMRPEVKAQKMKNNKIPHYLPRCKTCKDETAVIFSGSHENRKVVCWDCFTTAPQEGETKHQSKVRKELEAIGVL